MKKQIFFIVLAIATIFYAASSIAAPPFRLQGAKFILKQDYAYISDNQDSVIRERVYHTTVTRYDTVKTEKGFTLTPKRQTIPVVVRFAVALSDLGIYEKVVMQQVTKHRLGRLVTTVGIKDRPSYVADNHISELLLKQNVMVSFLGDDFTYTKYVSGKAYRVIFEGEK